jgi:hypothetical protein
MKDDLKIVDISSEGFALGFLIHLDNLFPGKQMRSLVKFLAID